MNRAQKRSKLSPLEKARKQMLALSDLAVANDDTIMMPKLAYWSRYVCRNPETEGASAIFKAIDRYFSKVVKEVEQDLRSK